MSESFAGPSLLWSSSCALKPPAVPRPRIGGGSTVITIAPSIAPSFLFSSAAICGPRRPGRSSKFFSGKNTIAASDERVKTLIDKQIGRASCRERVGMYGLILVVDVSIQNKINNIIKRHRVNDL